MPTPKPWSYYADISVTRVPGVGPKHAAALAEVGITTVAGLVSHYPRRWIDRTRQAEVIQLRPGEEGMVVGTVRSVSKRQTRQRRTIVEVVVHDGTAGLVCTFFNQPWRAKQLQAGTEVTLFGKFELFRGRRQMTNPVVDLLGDVTGCVVPVYPQSEKSGLTTADIRKWVAEALKWTNLVDPVPTRVLNELGLMDRNRAMRQIHEPETMGAAHAARKRLAFDELFRLQCVLVLRKTRYEAEATGVRHRVPTGVGDTLVEELLARLPFPLTGAQRRAIDEITSDLAKGVPMHRLLQGDVGAGKTLVALACLLVSVDGGHQAALMAPTEVLAEQHFLGLRPLLAGLQVGDDSNLFGARDVRMELLTNRTTAAERKELLPALARGEIDILVGTHALLTEHVAFADLGAVVIDEQHRFGVEQRSALRDKGGVADPDLLVMTATPIPRTAAMTVFGDLDVTVLDELPPGRTPIRTTWARTPMDMALAWETVRQAVRAGQQAYVVCPLVEGSDKIEAASATETFEELVGGELYGLRMGLLHGQLHSTEKEAVMASFRAGELDVLVSTTVIEVGVDVPNATVMVIVDADRFGIAQLHQLRGRVGRGKVASQCFLLGGTDEEGNPKSEDVFIRLGAMERTTDGFELAEVDLELRGEGTILGTRQKGRSDLKLASLAKDAPLVAEARRVAMTLVGPDGPGIDAYPDLKSELRDQVDPDEAGFLFKS